MCFLLEKKLQCNEYWANQRYFNPKSGRLLLFSKSNEIYPEGITKQMETDLCARMFTAALLTNMNKMGNNVNIQQQGTS